MSTLALILEMVLATGASMASFWSTGRVPSDYDRCGLRERRNSAESEGKQGVVAKRGERGDAHDSGMMRFGKSGLSIRV